MFLHQLICQLFGEDSPVPTAAAVVPSDPFTADHAADASGLRAGTSHVRMRLPEDASSPIEAPFMRSASLTPDADLDLLFDPSLIPASVKDAFGSDLHVRLLYIEKPADVRSCVRWPAMISSARTLPC